MHHSIPDILCLTVLYWNADLCWNATSPKVTRELMIWKVHSGCGALDICSYRESPEITEVQSCNPRFMGPPTSKTVAKFVLLECGNGEVCLTCTVRVRHKRLTRAWDHPQFHRQRALWQSISDEMVGSDVGCFGHKTLLLPFLNVDSRVIIFFFKKPSVEVCMNYFLIKDVLGAAVNALGCMTIPVPLLHSIMHICCQHPA